MKNTIESPEEHIRLLGDKEFLAGNIKDGAKVGYWTREFMEKYDQARVDGKLSDQLQKFTMSLSGAFNGALESVHFLFRYQYTPDDDRLSLFSVHARLGKESKSLYLAQSEDLPTPAEWYNYLRRPRGKENDKTMFIRNYFHYLRDRNPDNDRVEEPLPFKKRAMKF